MLCITEVISKSELCYLLLPVCSVSIPLGLGCISGGDSNTFLYVEERGFHSKQKLQRKMGDSFDHFTTGIFT